MDDIVIIGGGIIGTASAYFLSKEGRKVKVIEQDPTYKKASFPLSLGGFRRQFFQKENILLGKFAREFIFQVPELLKTKNNPNPTTSVVANGYLFLFGPDHAPEQYEALKNHKICEAGTKNIKGSELKSKFPYVNDKGIETVTYTDDKKEGWRGPISNINKEYFNAEFIDNVPPLDNDLVIWKAKVNGKKMPKERKIRFGNIDSACFAVKAKLAKKVGWRRERGGDYDFLNRFIEQYAPKITWYTKTVIKTNEISTRCNQPGIVVFFYPNCCVGSYFCFCRSFAWRCR